MTNTNERKKRKKNTINRPQKKKNSMVLIESRVNKEEGDKVDCRQKKNIEE